MYTYKGKQSIIVAFVDNEKYIRGDNECLEKLGRPQNSGVFSNDKSTHYTYVITIYLYLKTCSSYNTDKRLVCVCVSEDWY